MNFKTKIIKIEGKNLESFFQNLITNDIKLLEHNQALYSAMLTPQGKFLHDFMVIKKNQDFYLEVNEKNINDIIKVFQKYDLRKNLKISCENTVEAKVILYKDLSKTIIENLEEKSVMINDDFIIFSDPRKKRYLARLWILKKGSKLINQILKSKTLIKDLNLFRIKNTIPDSSIDLDIGKSFILNYNFDKLNAVSFKKGCYIGQENTSRQHYRGNVKYILKTIELVSGSFPKTNYDLFSKKEKIGVMKSSIDNYGLALMRVDATQIKNDFLLDKINSRIKVI